MAAAIPWWMALAPLGSWATASRRRVRLWAEVVLRGGDVRVDDASTAMDWKRTPADAEGGGGGMMGAGGPREDGAGRLGQPFGWPSGAH